MRNVNEKFDDVYTVEDLNNVVSEYFLSDIPQAVKDIASASFANKLVEMNIEPESNEVYNRLTNNLESDSNENSQLQSQDNGDIIENNQETGVDIDGSTNTELLAGGEVSAVSGSGDGVRQQSENSRKLAGYLGTLEETEGQHTAEYRAGESGWLFRQNNQEIEGSRNEESLLRTVSGISLSGRDTAGRTISPETAKNFEKTVFKDKNGNLLSLYHWTTAVFDKFAKGEFGFHFGTLEAAHDRYSQTKEKHPDTPIGIYKEVYINMTNPFCIDIDAGRWCAYDIAYQLEQKGIITEQQYKRILGTKGLWEYTYDNPAAKAVREILSQNGYDGIIYKNDSEDAGSYSVIALYPDQILTVAENGVLKENSGVTEADTQVPANFMPENETPSVADGDSVAASTSVGASALQRSPQDTRTLKEGVLESGEYGLSNPTDQEIHREPTQQEYNEAMFGKMKTAKQRHILDVAEKLDSGMKVVFVSENAEVLSGQEAVYMHDSNTIYLSEANSAVKCYYQLFKHEFIHRLESKGAYQSFKNYLFRNSSSFERYARARLGKNFEGTREEALQALAQKYIDTVRNGTFSQDFKKSFTEEDAQREMVADFISEVLFKGNRKDVAQHLSDSNLEAIYKVEDTLAEFENLTETDRNWFQRIVDWIKDLIASLKGVNQNKRLVEDLEYIEKRLGRVYDSWDTKKAAKNSGGVQFSFNNSNNSESKFIIDTINENINLISEKSIFSVKSEKIPEETKKTEYVLSIFNEQGNVANNKEIGSVELVQSGAKSTVFHGFGAEKLAATKAIKTVIEQGNIIKIAKNYNNTGVDRYVMAAKGEIDGKPAFVGLIIKAYPNQKNQNAKFYLHEATIIETDSPIMTAPQLSVDAVSESVYKNSVPHEEDTVNSNSMQETKDYSESTPKGKRSFSLSSPAQQMRDNIKRYESGEITREEYLEKTDELWGEANETYGMLPQGENAKAPIATPQAIDEDKPTERFTRTIIETGKLTDEMLEGMEEKVLLGDFSYEMISDEKATQKADAAIKNGTAEDTWENVVHGSKTNKNQIAIGERLLKDAIESGNTKRVLELSAELADIFTRAGQVVQAARLLKKMTGAGRLVSAQRAVKTLNRDMQQKYGEDFSPIKISTETAKRLAFASLF